MLMLAGLLGMVALSASALVGFSGSDDDDSAAVNEDIEKDGADATAEVESASQGSILDFMSPNPEWDAATMDPEENSSDLDADGAQIAGIAARLASEDDPSLGDSASAEDTPTVRPAEVVAVGTPEEDSIEGSEARDVVNGYAGADSLTGGAAEDQLWGGLGADNLSGGTGDDTLNGDADADTLTGDEGDDRLFGHEGADDLSGGAGQDSLVGGDGDDMLDGGAGDDTLHGGLGDDNLRGGHGNDVLFGGWGDDTLSGYEDDSDTADWDDTDVMDFLNGGGGNDVITAGAGDVVTTGEGADTVILGNWLSAAHQAEILDFEPDEDTLMVIYDDLNGEMPDVDLAADPDDDGIMHVVMNGVAIAAVNNAAGLNAGHITLLGTSLLGTQMQA